MSQQATAIPLRTVSGSDSPETPEIPATPPPRRRKAPWILGALVLAAAAGATYLFVASAGKESSDDAQVEGHVSSVAARIPGEVKRVLVRDNQHVHAGDVLVELDDADYVARLDAARADLAAAEAALNAAETQHALTQKQVDANLTVARGGVAQAAAVSGSTEAQIDQARAGLAAAGSRAELARLELGRAQRLFDTAAIPQSELDSRRATADQADADVAHARALLASAEANRSNSSGTVLAARGRLASAQTAPEQVASAQAQVDLARAKVAQARSAVRIAELNVGYTRIRAEIDGDVARSTVEPGQIVGPDRPLMALVGSRELWVVANLKETQLAHVRPGQRVDVKIDTFDGQALRGVVDSVQPGTGARFAMLPPDNASGNFTKVTQRVPVRIELSDPSGLALRPGLSADVTIYTE